MRKVWALLLLAVMLAACRESGGEGEPFAIQGKLIVFNYRVASATYLVTLKPLRPIQEGDVAVARGEQEQPHLLEATGAVIRDVPAEPALDDRAVLQRREVARRQVGERRQHIAVGADERIRLAQDVVDRGALHACSFSFRAAVRDVPSCAFRSGGTT